MELEQRPFPLRATLESIKLILNIRAEEKNIFLKESIDEGIPDYVVGDETRFTQVITNLLGNAIKFTEKGQEWLKNPASFKIVINAIFADEDDDDDNETDTTGDSGAATDEKLPMKFVAHGKADLGIKRLCICLKHA
jgi:nitrogen fixation/metabolism regulation signal transduction histidine kinase